MGEIRADVVIVGAGLAGLLAAQVLERTGCRVVILEKSRGVGGRMATRYFAGASFDHGVQTITARSARFRACVEGWSRAGVVTPWYTRTLSDGEMTYYRGVPAMNAVGKHLAQGLDVHTGALVTAASRRDGLWSLKVEGAEDVEARFLLMTAPAAQSRAILDAGGYVWPPEVSQALHGVNYVKMLTVLALLDGPSGLPEPGVLEPAGGEPVVWVSDNAMKGVSAVPALTIHSGAEFGQRFFDSPDEVRLPLLLASIQHHLSANVTRTQVHRWRYAFRRDGISGPCLAAPETGVWFAGDAFIDERVEGAALSGLAAADCICEALQAGSPAGE
jgi:predicted NAD/FAD-dependent oxidoreductase